MKKLLLAVVLIASFSVCYADTPYIPDKLTNPNYDFQKERENDKGDNAFPFVPCTVPVEKQAPKVDNNTNVKPMQPESNAVKFGRFLQNALQ